MDIGLFIKEYGLLLTAVGYFLYKQGWPFLRDKLYSSHLKTVSSNRSALKKTEDRLFEVTQENARMLTECHKTLQSIYRHMAIEDQPAIVDTPIEGEKGA